MSDQLREAAEAVVYVFQPDLIEHGAHSYDLPFDVMDTLRQALAATARQAEVDAAMLEAADALKVWGMVEEETWDGKTRRFYTISEEDKERLAEAVRARRAHMKGVRDGPASSV